VFKPDRRDFTWREVALKIATVSSFVAASGNWLWVLVSEWIMPFFQAILPLVVLEVYGRQHPAAHLPAVDRIKPSWQALFSFVCSFYWTRKNMVALNHCRTVYLEQVEAQRVLSVLYQQAQNNYLPYRSWLESQRQQVKSEKQQYAWQVWWRGRDFKKLRENFICTIESLERNYKNDEGGPLLDFTHPSKGRQKMWEYTMCRAAMAVESKIHQARCDTVVAVNFLVALAMAVIGFRRQYNFVQVSDPRHIVSEVLWFFDTAVLLMYLWSIYSIGLRANAEMVLSITNLKLELHAYQEQLLWNWSSSKAKSQNAAKRSGLSRAASQMSEHAIPKSLFGRELFDSETVGTPSAKREGRLVNELGGITVPGHGYQQAIKLIPGMIANYEAKEKPITLMGISLTRGTLFVLAGPLATVLATQFALHWAEWAEKFVCDTVS
jgi:hypothetical protein